MYNPGPTRAAALTDEFKNYMVRCGKATLTEIKWSDNTAAGAQLADVNRGWSWDRDGINWIEFTHKGSRAICFSGGWVGR